MKRYLLVALLAVMLVIVGCAEKVAEQPAAPVQEEQPAAQAEQPTTPPAETTPVEETATASEETKTEESGPEFVVTGDVDMLGKAGFEPMNIKIKAGEAITFVNKNPSQIDKYRNAVLMFENKADGRDEHSPQIPWGESYTHQFDEPGEYRFWEVGYGIFGTIVVE